MYISKSLSSADLFFFFGKFHFHENLECLIFPPKKHSPIQCVTVLDFGIRSGHHGEKLSTAFHIILVIVYDSNFYFQTLNFHPNDRCYSFGGNITTSLTCIKTLTCSTLVGWCSCGTFLGGWQWWWGGLWWKFLFTDKDKSKTEKDKFLRQKSWGAEHGGDGVVDLYYLLKMIDWGRGLLYLLEQIAWYRI